PGHRAPHRVRRDATRRFRSDRGDVMTAIPATADPTPIEGVRTRTVSWTDPARARFDLRDRDGYHQLRAMARGLAAAPPAVALLGLHLDTVHRGRVVFSVVADEMHENPMGTM